MSLAVGIDLGTTNTVVAAVVGGVAITLVDQEGRRLLPSVVSFGPSGEVMVGARARTRRLTAPEDTIFSVKTLLGRAWDSEEVKAARARLPFQLAEGEDKATTVVVDGRAYTLPELSAFVLRRAKAIAESALGDVVDRAVITVPANFNDVQRESTKLAGQLAGLEVLRIINEPTAAALAYGQSLGKAERVCIYDLGGGTFDVTLLDLTTSVFEVLATAGDSSLGGDDFDLLIADMIADATRERFGVDPRSDPSTLAHIMLVAESLKKDLSLREVAEQEIHGGDVAPGNEDAFSFRLTRQELERAAQPLIERTLSVAQRALASAGLRPRDFDGVLLVGGSTRMPMVERAVQELFGRVPNRSVDPDEVVAIGASIQAYSLTRSTIEALPNSPPGSGEFSLYKPPSSLSFEGFDETTPASARLNLAAVVRDAVAEAQAQAGRIAPISVRLAEAAPLLIDVTPLSLGVEIVGGYVDVLIPAGAPVPCEKVRAFSTATDGQVAVTIRVAQGEEERFDANTCLGELELSGLRSAPRGQVKVEVTFELDADGILRVRARDVYTGQQTHATMRLLGATNDASRVAQLLARQAEYAVT